MFYVLAFMVGIVADRVWIAKKDKIKARLLSWYDALVAKI